MRRFHWKKLVLTMALAIAFGAPGFGGSFVTGQDSGPTPEQQYKTLRAEYDKVGSSGKILTDAERLEFIGKVYRHHDRIAEKLVELAEKHPGSPAAIDALLQAIWQVNTTPWPVELVGRGDAWKRALVLLERDHITSEKLGPACVRLSWGFRGEYETFLRAVIGKNPHREVKGKAILALAHYLNNRKGRADLLKTEPQLSKEFEDLYGKDYLRRLFGQDASKVDQEAEALLTEAVKNYGDVKLDGGESIAKKAGAELFELRNLAVGKVAPETGGKDQDGVDFKLSDYRGKVVLLDFWSEY